MKVQMLRTIRLAGMMPANRWTFFKGRKYEACVASNQPNYVEMKKIFVQKESGECMLLVAGDYKTI